MGRTINEKFTEGGDPVKDMGIGRDHWFDTILKIFAEEYFDGEETAELFMEVAEDELEKLYQQGLSEKEAAKFCFDSKKIMDEFDKRYEAQSQPQGFPEDDLKANCRSWQGAGDKESANELTTYLINRYPDYDENELRELVCDWVGYEESEEDVDESYVMKSLQEGCNCGGTNRPRPKISSIKRPSPRPIPRILRPTHLTRPGASKMHEKFTEQGDPIKNMGIGLTLKQIAEKFVDETWGNITKISENFFGDKNHIGQSYIIYKFFKKIKVGQDPQRAFYDACESENYYGDRPDIVQDRKEVSDVLKEHFNIEVDWIFESVNENFTEESDPIKDLKIGVITIKLHPHFDTKNKKITSKKLIAPNLYTIIDFKKYLKKNNITYEIIKDSTDENWPTVYFTGTKSSLINMMKDIFDADDVFINNIFSHNIITFSESKNNKNTMKKLNEEQENKDFYDIKKLCVIALRNTNKWIDPDSTEYFNNEMERMHKKEVPFEEVKEFLREFLDAHIDKFFEVLTTHSTIHIERNFLDDNRDEIIETIIKLTGGEEEPDKDDVAEIIKRAKEKEKGPKDYSKMGQYDLKKEVDKALDVKDYETLKKIQPYIKEGFLKYHVDEVLNEEYVMIPLVEKFKEGTDPIHDMRIGMISIEMDTCVDVKNGKIDPYGRYEERFLLNYLKKHNITYEVINPEGPGGGMPVIEYNGTRKDIIRMLEDQFGVDDPDDLAMYLGED
jgi:hypothetical protein